MTWRTALGLKPTATDLAQDLLKAAERHGLTGWQHDYSSSAGLFTRPCVRPAPATQRRDSESPHGLSSVATSCSKTTCCNGGL
jgi:hypothetical protein